MHAEEPAQLELTARELGALLDLGRRARQAGDVAELEFLAVNDSHGLAAYRQAALWLAEGGIHALSGVVQIEANAPYVQWLDKVCVHLAKSDSSPRRVSAIDLPHELAEEWAEWLPMDGLWIPLREMVNGKAVAGCAGGLFLVRDTPWSSQDMLLLSEWMDIWSLAWFARSPASTWTWHRLIGLVRTQLLAKPQVAWWKQRRVLWVLGVVVLLALPVRLTVLAPSELVAANPTVIRAPMDGVVGSFLVKPNETVKLGQPLLSLDDVSLQSRLEVAQQALSGAQAEYRQAAQLAVTDVKYKGQLALLMSKMQERQAEADYLQGQLGRAHILAPQNGIALFDDPSEWIGKPVVTGERIMRIAAEDDVEVEAWLAVGDAIVLPVGAPVSLYLNSSPLFSVSAQVRYVAHDAVQRPDGSYAYRVRAGLSDKTTHRVGLKGTAKLSGQWVPLAYWVLRRPVAAVRQMIGW
jgi:multidrug resistance efflux pump